MDLWDVGKLALIVATPTLLGAVVVWAPKWCGAIAARWEAARPQPPEPFGPPIEQLAADLRRLLRLHSELTASAHLAMRAHRLWAVEAAIGTRAIEAARALGVAHPEIARHETLTCRQLHDLLMSLAASGLALPARVGPFTSDGRI
ncbi:hypothetical protein [Paractinoplanes maris]|uniref:hypothetical protein n=1 Tax=Paractinoplanes maris TaxID=1734446 RepID=UPI0020227444|nr:hypothetical protein [Actinoplanes maris]